MAENVETAVYRADPFEKSGIGMTNEMWHLREDKATGVFRGLVPLSDRSAPAASHLQHLEISASGRVQLYVSIQLLHYLSIVERREPEPIAMNPCCLTPH
jgi:hypothetical protein